MWVFLTIPQKERRGESPRALLWYPMQCVEVAVSGSGTRSFLTVPVCQHQWTFHLCPPDRLIVTGYPAEEGNIPVGKSASKGEGLPDIDCIKGRS